MPLSKTITITQAKRTLLDLVEEIETTGETVTITKNGLPTTIMLNLGDYESLMETLEILANKDIMKSLKKSEKDIQENRIYSEEEVWG